MKASKRSLLILLIVAAMVAAFLLGTISVTGSVPSGPEALDLTTTEWAALKAANALLLDQGPAGTYLPIVLRH